MNPLSPLNILIILCLAALPCQAAVKTISTQRANAVLAGEAWNALHYNSNGQPAVLYWSVSTDKIDSDWCDPDFETCEPVTQLDTLKFLYKTDNGTWSEESIASASALGWSPLFSGFTHPVSIRDYTNASLLFDKNGQAHVFAYNVKLSQLVHYVRNDQVATVNESGQTQPIDAHWSLQEVVTAPIANEDDQAAFYMPIVQDAQGYWHVILNSYNQLYYGTNKSGQWEWEVATDRFDLMVNEDGGASLYLFHYLRRFVSLAVDAQGYAHIVYCPAFEEFYNSNMSIRSQSQLNYATNRSGQWASEIVSKPLDSSADAGYGGTVAIDPTTQQATVASFYVDRANTGSAKFSRLLFHQKKDGKWNSMVVASKADGYNAKDGNIGTGFAPFLQYNPQGKPEIVFSDHASQHFSFGSDELAGQIRHAQLSSSNKWTLRTLFKQRNPLRNQIIYPCFALNNTSRAFAGTIEKDTLGKGGRILNAAYSLVIIEEVQ